MIDLRVTGLEMLKVLFGIEGGKTVQRTVRVIGFEAVFLEHHFDRCINCRVASPNNFGRTAECYEH